MANNKETYIGNSKLKNSPEKPLKVILGEQIVKSKNIADGAVTKGKLGDESVEWKNISEDVQNIIASMEKGGVALSGEFGGSEMIGINQKKLTEEIGPEGVITQKVATLEEVVGEGDSIDERIATAKSELIDGASEEGDTFKKLEDRLSDVEESVGEGGSVDERIAAGVSIERNRAQAAEELLREAYESLSQSQPIPKTAEEWAAMTSWEEGVIYRVAGTTSYTDYMYNGTTPIPMATYNNAIDDEPTTGSDNLVKSGGTMDKMSLLYNKLVDLFINDATCRETSEDGLFICDEQGYAAINLFDLDIETDSPIEFKSVSGDAFVICDEQGYVYIDFSKGIKTKTWDGNYLYPSTNINRGTTDLTGCINKAYDMIHTKWPTAQVFVCSIMKMGRTMVDATWSYLRHNESDQSYNQYNKRIRECAELAGFTFIDLWGEMSIDPLNTTQAPIYFHNAQEIADRGVNPNRINDRLHPIQAGHERIAKVIYNHLVNANGDDTWQGKKAIFFGDSITDNKDGQHTDKVYYSYLTDWLQLKDDGMNPNGYSTKNTVHYPQNAGAYGTGYMLEWERQGNLYERIPNYNNDYDLVVIMLGVNDFQEPLGEIYNY